MKELRKFQLAVENASDHIIITDRDGKVLFANRAASKIRGRD
jgi:PAS domain S-box-containing protein